jgi:hypothetical protein
VTPDTQLSPLARGLTPREFGRRYRVSAGRVRAWIANGQLGAVNTSTVLCGRPRYVILPHHVAEWERGRQVTAPPKPQRRRRPPIIVDYFPD